MAVRDSTRRLAGSSLSAQSDEFDAIFRRLLISINHVRLVAQHFGDLSGLSAEDAPAGTTLHQAAADLDRLHNELDAWDVRYDHIPKSPGAQIGLGAFTDDDAARTPLTGLPPALPCPFCGRSDDIKVSQTEDAGSAYGPWFVSARGNTSCKRRAVLTYEAEGGSLNPSQRVPCHPRTTPLS
jgi:hypothetical protein